MTIAEERLLAYVDGRLAPDDAAEVERALPNDPEAQALVETLRAAALPYRDAVETLIAVPDLSDIRQTVVSSRTGARPQVRRWLSVAAALAVFFVGGIGVGRYGLPTESPTPQTQWAQWLDSIATYQALYTRATLGMPNPPAERRARQMTKISAALGSTVKAPDFSAEGASYKFAWIYAIDGAPLGQIAYLPKSGKPFSLCIMKTDLPDHAPRFTVKHGMQMATWRHNGVAWVFVGGVTRSEMDRYIAVARAQTDS